MNPYTKLQEEDDEEKRAPRARAWDGWLISLLLLTLLGLMVATVVMVATQDNGAPQEKKCA